MSVRNTSLQYFQILAALSFLAVWALAYFFLFQFKFQSLFVVLKMNQSSIISWTAITQNSLRWAGMGKPIGYRIWFFSLSGLVSVSFSFSIDRFLFWSRFSKKNIGFYVFFGFGFSDGQFCFWFSKNFRFSRFCHPWLRGKDSGGDFPRIELHMSSCEACGL